MTKEETAKLLTVMTATYSNLKFSDPQLALETWWRILEPDDSRLVMDAFTVYARTDTSGFAPSPGKLHMMIADRTVECMTDGEVIGLLDLAARNANYGFQEEYDKLPPLLQKAVGSPTTIRSWGTMEREQLEYTFNNLTRAYKALVARQKTDEAATGLSIHNLTQQITEGRRLNGYEIGYESYGQDYRALSGNESAMEA